MKVVVTFTAEVAIGNTGMISFVIDKESVTSKTKDIIIHHWSSEVLPDANSSQPNFYSSRPATH
jgi:hypothetical protein